MPVFATDSSIDEPSAVETEAEPEDTAPAPTPASDPEPEQREVTQEEPEGSSNESDGIQTEEGAAGTSNEEPSSVEEQPAVQPSQQPAESEEQEAASTEEEGSSVEPEEPEDPEDPEEVEEGEEGEEEELQEEESQEEEKPEVKLIQQTIKVSPTEETAAEKRDPYGLYTWMANYWNWLFGRPVEAASRAARTTITITGLLPENAKAEVKVVPVSEEDIYSEIALFGYEIRVMTADGENFTPAADSKIDISITGTQITSALRDKKTILVYTDAGAGSRPKKNENAVADSSGLSFDTTELPVRVIVTTQEPVRSIKVSGDTDENAVSISGMMSSSITATVTSEEPETYDIEGQDTLAAMDISLFHDGTGEYQPDTPVSVTISNDVIGEALAAGEELSLWHIGEDGTPALVDSAVFSGSAVTFQADSFSSYVITKKSIEQSIITADGSAFNIIVSYDDNANIPDGSTLSVTEIGGEQYESYYGMSAAVMNASGFQYARIFDIKILSPEGGELQPAAQVDVTIELMDAASASEEFSVIHFGSDGSATEIQAQTEGDTVQFSTDGFSVYSIVQGPEAPEGDGITVQTTGEFSHHYSDEDGFILSVTRTTTPEYFTNTLNGSGAFQITSSISGASPWYFESAGAADDYYIYVMSGTTKKYIYNTAGNNLGLSETEKTGFILLQEGTSQFRLKVDHKVDGEDKYVQYSGSGKGMRLHKDINKNGIITIKYAVPHEIEDDVYKLDGKSYGISYYDGGINSYGLLPQTSDAGLRSQQMLTRADPQNRSQMLEIAKDTTTPMWTFESVGGDQYYLSTEGKYLCVSGGKLTVADEPGAGCVFRVVPGTGTRAGKIKLVEVESGLAVNYGNAIFKTAAESNAAAQWLSLAVLSPYTEEDFVAYSATKVSISDNVNVTNGSEIIIYTRVWNETKKSYDFYAVDHNGDLVPAFESGDSLVWIGTQNNTLLWKFSEYYYPGTTSPNFYYDLQNGYTGKYLAPQISGGQIFADAPIGVNVNGRRYGDYYSPILAWDDTYYDYAGLKTENGHIVSCPMSQAETFYVATIHLAEPGQGTLVPTLDHNALGLTVKMIDYSGTPAAGPGGGSPSTPIQNAVMGTSTYTEGRSQPGLISGMLGANGYPTATNTGRSLSELFQNATPVNHLFIQSIYEGSGYYQFDSTENFAHLNGTDFAVYKELGGVDGSAGTRKHGQFMPYNTLDFSRAHPVNPLNLTDIYGNTLSDNYPRKYETVYALNEPDNYYFGLEIEGHFAQPASGKDAWGHDIVFEFVGDDDFWLYVDGILILDLGGIHKALGGNVNYSTGQIVCNGTRTTLYDEFRKRYAEANGLSESDPAVAAFLEETFTLKDGNYVFKDYSAHTVRMFYMERGAGASNLRMRFNLSAVTPGQVLLKKEITGTAKQDYASVKFPFQIYYDAGTGDGYQLLSQRILGESSHWQVSYENTSAPVEHQSSATIDGVTYDEVFFLKPGQTAAIKIPDDAISYYIRECGVPTDIYDSVTVNDEVIEGEAPEGSSSTKSYTIEPTTVSERARVTFQNHVDKDALRVLTISKRLFDAQGNELTAAQDNTGFRMRLYLGENLDYYRMGDYFVRDPNGYYCYFDAATQSFASIGSKNFDSLTPGQVAKITFQTSPSGAADKLPAGYDIEIRDLMVGTKFKVEEPDYDIPVGYGRRVWTETANGITTTYDGFKRVAGSYIVEQGDTQNSGTIRDNSNPHIEVHNQRGWGIRAEKVWSDSGFMLSHDNTYFAVFVNGQMLPDSVRTIDSYNYTTYFFQSLQAGASFSDYEIREVKEENGSYLPLASGDEILLGGTTNDGSRQEGNRYTVSYTKGTAGGQQNNTRTDVVTNTRTGGLIIRKEDMDGSGLAGAVFELRQGNTVIGRFTSAQDGSVTAAYLDDGSYTLQETKAPDQYQTLCDSFSITVTNGICNVTGSDSSGYTFSEAQKLLVIKNRPFTLQVIKKDKDTGDALEGAHFALYKQIRGSNGLRKDYYPLAGFEDIVSGDDGVLPDIAATLPAGTYYLTETEPPAGHTLIEDDIVFTISATGIVTLSDTVNASLTQTGETVANYEIDVFNRLISEYTLEVTKSVTGDFGDPEEKFDFIVSGLEAGESYEYTRYTMSGADWTPQAGGTGALIATADGKITFRLSHDQKIAIQVPADSQLAITEDCKTYKPTYTIDEGESHSGYRATVNMTQNRIVAFTNRLDEIAPTGYSDNTLPYFALFAMSMVLAGFAAHFVRKKI